MNIDFFFYLIGVIGFFGRGFMFGLELEEGFWNRDIAWVGFVLVLVDFGVMG